MSGIEDLLDKANHKDISEHGEYIQQSIDGMRLELLAKHYMNSLKGEKLEEFKKLDIMERNIRLGKADYKLPGHHAEEFIMDVIYSTLAGTSPKKAAEMKKCMAVLNDKSASPDKKREAHEEIDHFMAMGENYGIDMRRLNEGKVQGFSHDRFRAAVRNLGETYVEKQKSFWLKQIDNDSANDYLESIKKHESLKKLNYELVKDLDMDSKRGMINNHYNLKLKEKQGGLDQFKKAYDKYFVKDEK